MWIRDAFVFVGSLARNNYPTPYLSLWPHRREIHSNTHNKLLRADSVLILAQNDQGGAMESRQSAARAPKTGQRAGDRRSPARRAGLGLSAAPPQKPIGPPQPYAHLAKVQGLSEINLFPSFFHVFRPVPCTQLCRIISCLSSNGPFSQI